MINIKPVQQTALNVECSMVYRTQNTLISVFKMFETISIVSVCHIGACVCQIMNFINVYDCSIRLPFIGLM